MATEHKPKPPSVKIEPMRRRPVKTALHQAVSDGRIHQARLLLASTSDIDITDANGWTPLMLTCILDRENLALKMMNMFQKRGAQLNIPDRMGRTPLMIAVLTDKIRIVRKLVQDINCEFDVIDNDGNTALMHAATVKDSAALLLILKNMIHYGMGVDTRNKLGYTALLLACKHGNCFTALQLMKQGNASPYLRDHQYKRAAMDWLTRFINEKSSLKALRGRFPHITLRPKTCDENKQQIQTLLERTYTATSASKFRSETSNEVMNKEIEGDGHYEINEDHRIRDELLRELRRRDTERERLHSRYTVQQNAPHRREIATATLRSTSDTGRRERECQPIELGHIFKLYALDCGYKARSSAQPANVIPDIKVNWSF